MSEYLEGWLAACSQSDSKIDNQKTNSQQTNSQFDTGTTRKPNKEPIMLRIRSCSKNSEMLKPFALLLILSAGLCLMTSGSVQAEASTEAEEAAEALLVEMDLETSLANSVDQLLALQIQMNPALAESADVMKEILAD